MTQADFHVLFCTAQVSGDEVNKLLKVSDSSSRCGNVWTLIRNHAQKQADKPTSYPIEEFQTSFQHASLDELGSFCREKFDPDQSPELLISSEDFAVMDERTLQDNTILLVKWDKWTERIDPDNPSDAEDAFRDREGWHTIRVPLEEAADTIDGIQYLDLYQADINRKTEDDGVTRF